MIISFKVLVDVLNGNLVEVKVDRVLKTLDNRYILKELSKLELESFVSIAPFYFKYISQSMFNTLTTAIAKIFGFYQVQIKNTTTGKIFEWIS